MKMLNNKIQTVYIIQLLFICGVTFGSKSIDTENVSYWLPAIVRNVLYFIIIKTTGEVPFLINNILQISPLSLTSVIKHFNWTIILTKNKNTLLILAAAISVLVYSRQRLFTDEFAFLFIAYLISKYPEMQEQSSTINYGVGMAYSFFEGYLVHIIPNDGHRFVGFQENIRAYEGGQNVFFPVKKLFIVITKSLYCPPDLKEFNKPNRDDLPYIEACKSLEDVEKDVAGVKNRTYRNSAYKIHREGRPPVYLAAECATPLHTLHRVLAKSQLYELTNVNVNELVNDFCDTLRTAIEKSPECRGKCELVYYDDTDSNQNLADVLLDKIREFEPDFENLIIKNNILRQ